MFIYILYLLCQQSIFVLHIANIGFPNSDTLVMQAQYVIINGQSKF